MSYSSGMLDKRIDILNRTAADDGDFGLDSGGVTWEKTCSAWASVSFVKGVRAMREGALDAYGVVMVRMRYNDKVNPRSRIVFEGDTYTIQPETFHREHRDNTIQFNAQVLVNPD